MINLEKSLLSKKTFPPYILKDWFEGLLSLAALYIFLVFTNFQSLLVFVAGLLGFFGIAKLLKQAFILDFLTKKSNPLFHQQAFSNISQSITNHPIDSHYLDELKQLKKLNEHQQTLTRMLVHDLKTPLSNILSLTEEHLEKSKQKQIYEAAKHMLRLTLDTLEVQKMKLPHFKPNSSPQNLSGLIEDAIYQVLGIARKKNIKIITEGVTDQVLADPRLTQRILINLIDNAIKFSPQNSTITIQMEQILAADNLPFAKISVTDQGLGISENEQSSVFDQFYQIHPQQSTQFTTGTGLGLSFCKMATEAQNGQIGVCSSPPAQSGSRFWFSLPIYLQTPTTSTTMTSYVNTRKALVLSQEDRQILEPWMVKLRQYEVYQLSKIKAILKMMSFDNNTNCYQWKLDIEQALYATNQAKYAELLR